MNIAVLGTGIVGQVIAARLAGLGHQVIIGTRDVANTLSRSANDPYGNPPFGEWFKQQKSGIRLGTFEEAAAFGAVLFNCTMGAGAVPALQLAGEANLAGKVLVDIANPLDFSQGMPPTLSPVNNDSLGETIQRAFPTLKVVKTLNTMNCYLMVNPALVPGDHTVFVCGNDAGAKATTKTFLNAFGWADRNIIDLGDISNARGTEQLLPIWIRLFGVLKTPMFNFNIVVAPAPK